MVHTACDIYLRQRLWFGTFYYVEERGIELSSLGYN